MVSSESPELGIQQRNLKARTEYETQDDFGGRHCRVLCVLCVPTRAAFFRRGSMSPAAAVGMKKNVLRASAAGPSYRTTRAGDFASSKSMLDPSWATTTPSYY